MEPQNNSSLLRDPDALLTAWEGLRRRVHHLHNPQAAAMLGVPEAALIAARIGSGAIALSPDAPALLAALAEWRRVLITKRSAAGVCLGFDHFSPPAVDGADLLLQGKEFVTTRLRASAVAHAYWFEERDAMHGRTQSLQLFDASGKDVLKVLILHKAAAEAAFRRFQTLKRPSQDRVGDWPAPVSAAYPPRPSSPVGEALKALLAALHEEKEKLDITSEHEWAQTIYSGPIERTAIDAGAAHAYAKSVKLHLRPMGVDSVAFTERGVRFFAEGKPALAIAQGVPSHNFTRGVAGARLALQADAAVSS